MFYTNAQLTPSIEHAFQLYGIMTARLMLQTRTHHCLHLHVCAVTMHRRAT